MSYISPFGPIIYLCKFILDIFNIYIWNNICEGFLVAASFFSNERLENKNKSIGECLINYSPAHSGILNQAKYKAVQAMLVWGGKIRKVHVCLHIKSSGNIYKKLITWLPLANQLGSWMIRVEEIIFLVYPFGILKCRNLLLIHKQIHKAEI